MKFLFDLFPVILFFATYSILKDIYVATAVAIIATLGQVAWSWFKHRKVDVMLWVSLGLITILGGATLLLRDKSFIMWKPTVLYWFIASSLLFSHFFFKKNLIKSMMKEQVELPTLIWNKLNYSWAVFFTAMGFLNLVVARYFTEATWVNFKLFGVLGLMLLFGILQSIVIAKYVIEDKGQT